MVFYRKYRPQMISELDNAKLRETLYSVLAKQEIPHAFLFTGPKGLGKTSTARIIAKTVNCERKAESVKRKEEKLDADLEPCNVCETCLSITKGNNIDILEIDGASNRGIDEIRELREKVRLAPSAAKKKVYIIDEVHMLTTEAFNALLKTIEEPPAHVLFIFCTTEPQKIPSTIISRCFHIPLSIATEEELIRSLQRVVDGEKLSIEPDALKAIAKLANGGFRDGTKTLEEIALLAKDQMITKAFVEDMYKVANLDGYVDALLQSFVKREAKAGLEVVSALVQQGADMKYVMSQVLQELHGLLLMSIGIENSVKREALSVKLSINEIQMLVALLANAYQEMRYAVLPQLPVEMVIVGWANQEQPMVQEDTAATEMPQISPVQNIAYSGKPTMTSLLKKQQVVRVQQMLNKPEPKLVAKPVSSTNQSPIPSAEVDPQKTFLENVIYLVKPYNASIAGVLRGCKILKIDDGSIIFEAAYKFHKERLDEGKSREILEKVVKEITGKQLGVQVVLRS